MNYFTDKDALDIPWVESPFFYELLKNSNLSKKEKEMCVNYHEKGYIIIDLDITDDEINNVTNMASDMSKGKYL